MWQRFTERSRKVIFYSQEEAQAVGQGFVGPEHILLGLLRESDSTACQCLSGLGVDLEALKYNVKSRLGSSRERPSQDMTLTPSAKRVIDLAYEEARELNNDFIGSEHLLLGLIRQNDGIVRKVFRDAGIHHDMVRESVPISQNEPQAYQAGKTIMSVFKEMLTGKPKPTSDVKDTHEGEDLLARYNALACDRLAGLLLNEKDCADFVNSLSGEPSVDFLADQVLSLLAKKFSGNPHPTRPPATATVNSVLQAAAAAAAEDGRLIDSVYILFAIANSPGTFLNEVFTEQNIDLTAARQALSKRTETPD